jgi:hypothetical protein
MALDRAHLQVYRGRDQIRRSRLIIEKIERNSIGKAGQAGSER